MTQLKQQLTSTTKSMVVNKNRVTKERKMQNGRWKVFAILLFLIYFAVLFYFLFFSEEMGRTYSERMYRYNLIPFLEMKRFIEYRKVLGTEAVVLNIVGNVVAFMPFGFFLPIFSSRCRYFLNTSFYTFELSLLVELLQLVTKVGSFDVDDLILNTLGGVLGFWIYYIGYRFMSQKKRQGKK